MLNPDPIHLSAAAVIFTSVAVIARAWFGYKSVHTREKEMTKRHKISVSRSDSTEGTDQCARCGRLPADPPDASNPKRKPTAEPTSADHRPIQWMRNLFSDSGTG